MCAQALPEEALPELRVRPYDRADVDAVVDLWYGTWHATLPDLRHHEPKSEWLRRFEQEIAVQERVYFADLAGRLAGCLAIRVEGGGRGYLHEIFVAPEHQGRGVGSVWTPASDDSPAG